MKRAALGIIAIILLAALALPAFAEAQVMFVNRDTLKVYSEQNKDSRVLKKLKGGAQVLIELTSEDQQWYGILVEDDNGQQLGWVQSKYMSYALPSRYCDHLWTDWQTVMNPTCAESGTRIRSCLNCGVSDVKEIKRLPHTFNDWQLVRAATCAQPGERVRVCQVCGYQDREVLEEPHTYGDWTLLRQPTCSLAGARERTCAVCGFVETEEIEKLPHDYAENVIVPATDRSSGMRSWVCRVCGATTEAETYDPEGTLRRGTRGDDVRMIQQLLVDQGYLNVGGADGVFGGGTEKAVMQFQKDQGLNPDGIVWPQTLQRLRHDFGPWETVMPLTRTNAGERMRVCRDCGYEQHEKIEAGTVIERRRRGEDVRAIQQMLNNLGFNCGSADGIYGPKLDSAFEAFAKSRGLTFEAGHVRPADVDALVNAWIASIPAGAWKGEGGLDSPVNLALSVTPSDTEAGNEDDAMRDYSWTLTNLGSEKCIFNDVLLCYGDAPDFTKDTLAMTIDGVELLPNCGNSAFGSFSVARDWGSGALNFSALAISESTGAKWLSNIVTFEAAPARAAARTVSPLPRNINVNALADGTYPVAFNRGDVLKGASGTFMNAVHIYAEDHYDSADIEGLSRGDILVVAGEPVTVRSIERNLLVTVNGGGVDGGCTLRALDGSGVYVLVNPDDLLTCTEQGVTTLELAPDAMFTDSSDVTAAPVVARGDAVVAALMASENDVFTQDNTTVRIEAGKVAEIHRTYVP